MSSEFRRRPSMAGVPALALLLPGLIMGWSQPVCANTEIEEITVTAQRRAESLQRVPIAISAFDASMITESKIDSIADLTTYTPNFNVTPFSTVDPQLFMRGIGSSDDGAGGDPSVLVFEDDVVHARASGALTDFFDVERIEVLRGPQGTLYGKNAVGGALRVITRAPSDTFESMVEFTPVGDHNRVEAKAMVNVPLNDTWAMRIAGSSVNHDGFNYSVASGRHVDDADSQNVRAKLRFRPNDAVDGVVTANYSRQRTYGNTRKPMPAGNFAHLGGANISPDPRVVQPDVDGWLDRDIASLALNLDWDTSIGKLTSVTAYREVEVDWYQALGALPVPPFVLQTDNLWRETDEQFTQEFRLAGASFGGRLDWVAGIFLLDETIDREEEFRRSFMGVVSNPNFVQYNNTESIAAFAHLDYSITDKLTVAGGLRYTRDSKDIDLAVDDLLNGTSGSLAPALAEYAISLSKSWSAWTPEASVNYRFNDKVMAYVRVSRGFKAGGFQTAPATELEASVSYDEENALTTEVGLKSDWFDNRLRANVAAFTNDYEDLQVLQLVEAVPGDVSTLVLVTDNAADAEIKGIELELTTVPLAGLKIGGSYSYIDATFTDFITNTGSDLSGNRLRRTPKDSYSVFGEFEHGLGSVGALTWRIDYVGKGDSYFENNNGPVSFEPSYSLLNGSLRYASPDKSWEVVLWGKNLTDEVYRVNTIVVSDSGFSRIGPPRTWGLTFRAHFGG